VTYTFEEMMIAAAEVLRRENSLYINPAKLVDLTETIDELAKQGNVTPTETAWDVILGCISKVRAENDPDVVDVDVFPCLPN
jgi:hypothetical protein